MASSLTTPAFSYNIFLQQFNFDINYYPVFSPGIDIKHAVHSMFGFLLALYKDTITST